MPRDGQGNFQLVSGNPVVSNTVISSTTQNNTMSDVASGLTQSLSRDGQTTPTANLTMGNFRLTNMANASARTDAVNAGQIQDNQLVVLSSIGGTGDAITASTAPAITVYTTDAKWVYTPTNANTLTNPTININGLGAKTITQSNGAGLWSGALAIGTPYELMYDGTNFRVQSGAYGTQTNIPQNSAFSMRNKIVDGAFTSWLGGTSFPISGASSPYTADMWLASAGTGGSATVSRFSIPAGSEPVGMASPAQFALQFQQTVASVPGSNMACRIESVYTFQGRSVTFGCWMWVTSGTLNIPAVQIAQIFGSGGSSTVLTNATTNWTLTTTPQFFSVRIDIPSISGKTVGTNDSLQLTLSFQSNTTFTVRTTQWQIEDCPANAPATGLPTPFEMRPNSETRSEINRFYRQVYAGYGPSPVTSGSAYGAAVNFDIVMRATPAVSFSTDVSVSSFPASSTNLTFPLILASGFNHQSVANATASGNYTKILICDARL